MFDHRAIQLHTDGSCYRNPGGQSGCAAFVVYPEDWNRPEEQVVDFGCEESNNNRMELMTCAKALEWALENQPWENVSRIYIVTDSQYLAKHHATAQYWKRNRWRNNRRRTSGKRGPVGKDTEVHREVIEGPVAS